MASVSESCPNAVQGSSSASQDKVGQFPMFLQGLAIILKDPDKSYQDKVCALLSAWERLASYSNQSSANDEVGNITDCLYRDTLRLVLRCEWTHLPQANKTHLTVTLQRTASSFSNTSASELCQHVIRLIKSPWDNHSLSKIFEDSDISDAEVLDFCVAENPVLLSARLDILCESKCEDLALKLVKVCRKCSSAKDTRFSAMCSSTQLEHWLDLHVALLYRAMKMKEELLPLIEQLTFDEGYQLVKRLIDRGKAFNDPSGTVSRSRVWRPSLTIAVWLSHCFITNALLICPPPPCLKTLIIQFVNIQKLLAKLSQDVMNMLRDLVDRVSRITSAHMYMLASTLSTEFGEEFKPLCIELYVRALAVDINYHEKLISKRAEINRISSGSDEASIQKRDSVELDIKQAETGLAEAVSSLADLVSANNKVCKECALTAFSLEPTASRFHKLVELASSTMDQSKGEASLARTTADLNVLPTPDYQQSIMEHSRNAVVGEPPPGSGGGPGGGSSPCTTQERRGSDCSTPEFSSVKEALEDADSGVDLPDVPNGSCDLGSPTTPTSDEEVTPYSDAAAASLGVSAAVIKDLAVVVHGVRWDVLNWKMGWKMLEPLCQQYLANPEMRSVTEELRFLKPDFSQFKDVPRPERDEFWGIEKGYEKCLEISEEETVESSKLRSSSKSKKSAQRRPASGSSSPQPGELAERKKVLKKKLRRESSLSLKTSSDSDSPRLLDLNEATELIKRTQRSKTKKTSPLIKTLRAVRPDFTGGTQWTDCTVPTNRLSLEGADTAGGSTPDSCSNNVQPQLSICSSSPPLLSTSLPSSIEDHFAPMLSTLDMNPKVVLKRTPVKSPDGALVKQVERGRKPRTSANLIRSCILSNKLDQKNHVNLERTMTNLKGLDNLDVRPQTTAVHMVQLPNPPANAHVATANGLSVSAAGTGTATTITNNGIANPDIRQEQQHQQEEANKMTGGNAVAAAPNGDEPPVFSSTTSVEITSAPSGTNLPEPVTLLSTPSVSIFQVAHRPAGNSGAVLQPVAAVTGFNPPNPRLKNPVVGTAARIAKGTRGASTAVTAVPARSTVEVEPLPSITLSQLLAQSPSTEDTVQGSPAPNGPAPPILTNKASRGGKRRVAPSNNSEAILNSDGIQASASVSSSSPSPADNNSPCHVPLVKYVDLNMVSSPSRPRPSSTAGMRRLSQGSNSNSPDPHRSTTKIHRGAQNPASPAINSPQSPALQAPPSPLSFRKQQQQQSHHIFRGQDSKALGGDRLASPSHPSQCSSPFSRPSSRSQDTSPSPSDLLGGSMFPPNFMPFSSDGGSNSNQPSASPNPGSSAPSSSRLPSFSGSSQPSTLGFSSALPKFGQAFSRKSHFEVIPSLGSLNSPPSNVITPSTSLPALNTISDSHIQGGRIANNSLGGNGFGGERRFPVEQNTPTDEVEGLGSKLSSLLESALNGQITRSPTRSLPSNQPVVSNPDLLLSDSAHSISPLVGGMDSQSGSEATGSGNAAFSEQLREFESIFAQVRGSQNPWPDQPDDVGIMGIGAVEFLPPPSTFSESMDVSEASLASPNSAEGPGSSQAEEPAVTNESPPGGQLHDLLSAASNARQALKNEEKESESSAQSPLAQIKLTSVKEEVIEEATTESRSEPETQSLSSDHAFPSPPPPVAPSTPKSNPTRLVVLPTVLTGPIVVQSTEAIQQNTSNVNNVAQLTAIKSEPTKNNRAKTASKSTPIVSPATSASNSPSKVTTPTSSSSSSSASSKAPQKAHDDEHTVLRVHAILEEYKEQLRNSPDLQNKPAPRRRSNPLPSPSTSAPKRRKSVQSKVKLLSQHVRPPDGQADGASNAAGSAESTPSASNEPQTSNSDNASPASDSNKTESNNQTAVPANSSSQEKQEGTVSVQMIPAGIQLSIPAGAVVTNRPATSTNDGTSASSAPVCTATVTVSTPQGTQINSLTGVPTVPLTTVLSQHQLLVSTGTAGVQRLQLVPLNFSPARAGSSPRGTYIQVRQVTMSGQPGVISFPARFTTPIRYVSTTQQSNQTGSQDQQPQQQIVVASLPKVATSTASETHLLLQEISSSQATATVVKPAIVSTAPTQSTSAVSLSAAGTPERSDDMEASPGTTQAEAIVPAATRTTTNALRLLPTVTKVNLPAAPNSVEEPILSPATLPVEPSTPTPPPLTLASAAIGTPLDSSSVSETEATSWSHHSSPNEQATAIDNTVTPVTDEKLLSDVETGVSEFLPCADFMGPGVSPSPCFSLSDSPLGSQESSPVTSPATFQASSTEEDSNSHAITGDDAMLSSAGSSKSNRAKILKRNNKPRMVMVRKDHGGMEYRRMSDGESGPGIIRNETQSLSKRLAAKRAAAVAAVGANNSDGSSPAHPASRSASPLASAPNSPASADIHSSKNDVKPKGITLMIKKNADKHVTVQKGADKRISEDILDSDLSLRFNNTTIKLKEEVDKDPDPLYVDTTTAGEAATEADGALATRPRRCSRFKKEPVEEPMEHDAQSCHLGGETKMLRRSSVRANVKKNCPCCVSGTNEKRKRWKSEPVETGSSDLPTLAKRGSLASQSFTEDTGTIGSPLTTRLAAANAAAKNDSTPVNRSKPAKKSQRKR